MRVLDRAIMATIVCTAAAVACATPPSSNSAGTADGKASDVVARYGDTTITDAELEDIAGAALVQLRQQIYDTKSQLLQNEIFSRLVDKAAAAADLSREDYLKREVDDKAGEPTEAEISNVMSQYRSRLPQDDAQARTQVVSFLNQQKRAQAQAVLRDALFADAGVEILLDPPRVKPVIAAHNPSQGPADAPIVLVEYTDFQCPYCVRVQGTIQQVLTRYDGMVLHVFKNLPLPMHQQAPLAAEAGMCAADQGGFWPMHDWLFANKANLNRDAIVAQAEAQGLNATDFATCLDGNAHAAEVAADAAEARSFGINGTPGFLVNGRVLSGAVPVDSFVEVIDSELRRAGIKPPEPPKPPAPEETSETTNESTEAASAATS